MSVLELFFTIVLYIYITKNVKLIKILSIFKKNLEEGRGFRLDNMMGGQAGKGGDFMFASANELWRASLDTLDFMPLSSVNYSGGIIVTDWYSDGNNLDESVKISIRFLTNEVRTDALDIKVFYKKCNQIANCKIEQKTGSLVAELKKEILSKAAVYKLSLIHI